MPWGVPVPGDDTQVMYVWFDALVNYISTLGWPDASGDFAAAWPAVQVAGRDNLRQQSAMWQAMLMSAGVAPSQQIFIHSYITAEGQKMSKSLGNVINPYDIVAEYGTDAVRFYLLGSLPSQRRRLRAVQMELAYAKLANGLGNLVSRVSAMANKYFDGDITPTPIIETEPKLAAAMADYDFRAYVDAVWAWVDCGNKKIDDDAPFKLVKTDAPAAKKSLEDVAGYVIAVAKALEPIIPDASAKILSHRIAPTTSTL